MTCWFSATVTSTNNPNLQPPAITLLFLNLTVLRFHLGVSGHIWSLEWLGRGLRTRDLGRRRRPPARTASVPPGPERSYCSGQHQAHDNVLM